MPIDRLALLAIDVVVNSGRAAVQMRNLHNTFRRNTQAVDQMNRRMTNAFIGTGIFFTVKQLINDTINVVDDLVRTFIELETILTDIDKIAKSGNLQRLADVFFRLNESLGGIASFKEVGQVMAAAARSGARLGSGLEQLTETAVRFAKVSGDITSQEAALGLARVADNFELGQRDIENLGAAIDKLSDSFTVTSGEILKTTARMAGIGQIAGMTAAETAALSTAILKTGVSQTVTRTAVTRLFTELQQQPLRAAAALKLTEQQARHFSDTLSGDFLSGIKLFIDQLDNIGSVKAQAALKELGISSSRVQQVLARLRVDWTDVTKAVNVANEEFKNGTALLSKQFKLMQRGSSQLQVLANRWEIFKASILESDAVLAILRGYTSNIEAAAKASGALEGLNFQVLPADNLRQSERSLLLINERIAKLRGTMQGMQKETLTIKPAKGSFLAEVLGEDFEVRPFQAFNKQITKLQGALEQQEDLRNNLLRLIQEQRAEAGKLNAEEAKANKKRQERLRLEKQAREIEIQRQRTELLKEVPQFNLSNLDRALQNVDRRVEAFANKITPGIQFEPLTRALQELTKAAEQEKQRLRREDAAERAREREKQANELRNTFSKIIGFSGEFGKAISMMVQAQRLLQDPFFQQAPGLKAPFAALLGAQIKALGKPPKQQRQFRGLTQIWKDAQLKTNKDDPVRKAQFQFANAALRWLGLDRDRNRTLMTVLNQINTNLQRRGRIQ